MKAVDLFAGCGGLSLGLQNSGIDVVAAYEKWKPALDIYRSNFQHPIYNYDLSNVGKSVNHIKQFKPDIIAGGPPCQDFSSAGKRDEHGGRGDLTLSFAQIVSNVLPQWFLMENVERINQSKIYRDAKTILYEAGYGLTETVLDASFCNVPQKRKRMFLIGKLGEKDSFLLDEIKNKLSNKSLSIREFFGNNFDTEFYYRHARSYSRRAVFSIDEPSPTIRGVNRPIPPNYQFHLGDATHDLKRIRPLTTLERARIQTFPIDFQWPISNKSDLEQLIGNAVPVNLAKLVGGAILAYSKSIDSRIEIDKVA